MARESGGVVPPSYYAGIADELDLIADSVRKNPDLHHHFASRLNEIALQLRQDLVLMRLQNHS